MNSLNSILIEGNMVRDPLLKSTPNGTIVCSFSIASNRFYWQDSNMEREVSFFEVEAWGRVANSCANYGRKGRGVRVVGRLRQERWVGSDGKNHTRVSIVAEHVEYRSDFKKTGETAAGGEALSNAHSAASGAGILAEETGSNISMYEGQMEDAKIEELQALAF